MMMRRRSLGRLIWQEGGAFSSPFHYRYNKTSSSISSPFLPFRQPSQCRENPISINCEVEEAKRESDCDLPILRTNCTKKEKVVDEELTSIKKGDIVNLSDLIFTKNRDYLIKCNDGQRVKFEQLAGKVVVICFDSVLNMYWNKITYLMDIHKELQPDNGFEVVFVDVNDVDASEYMNCAKDSKTIFGKSIAKCFSSFSREISTTPSRQEPQKLVKDIFSSMPWTAIPLSDITSRRYLKQRFGVPVPMYCNYLFVIDPTGTILQCREENIFQKFGALGYPFSDERINYLKSEDDEVVKHPSLKALLASPQRDYLISNKGDKVPIHSLEDKVVALYFYEEGFTDENITLELKRTYKLLAKREKKFEVVLIYLHKGPNTSTFTNEDSFWKTFRAMPWLALPFRDSNYKKLERIFHYPWMYDEPEFALTIIGPRVEFIEPFGASILHKYKVLAFPFSRDKVAKLLSDEAKELKLEMLWDPEGDLGEKYGFPVQYSQIAGKKVIIIFESFDLNEPEFLETLKEKYNQVKGTADEFEVIHFIEKSFKNESKVHPVTNLPWFVLPAVEHQGYESHLFKFYKRYDFDFGGGYPLIAFDRDGRVVRRTVWGSVMDSDFPFYDGGLEKEALSDVVIFGFEYSEFFVDQGRPGMIYSYKKERIF